MGKRYTEAQARAAAKYIANQDEIKIRVPKGKKDEWKLIAEEKGCELPRLMLRLEVGASCFIDLGYCHTYLAVFPKSPQAY